MNAVVLNFLLSNWLVIILLLVIFFPMIPPKWLGLRETYFDIFYQKELPIQKYSIVRALIHALLTPLQEFIVMWGLKGTTSIVIFMVIGADLILRKQLTKEAVTLVSIGILALYLEQLIDKAKRISVWKFFEWESKS